MFKVTQRGDHRLDIELSGRLDSDEMKAALDDLIDKSDAIENGKMFYDIIDFNMPSINAIAIELSRLPELFGLIKKYSKVAVLSDTSWIKKASELEGMLIPGLDIKAFDREQRADAEKWLESDEAG